MASGGSTGRKSVSGTRPILGARHGRPVRLQVEEVLVCVIVHHRLRPDISRPLGGEISKTKEFWSKPTGIFRLEVARNAQGRAHTHGERSLE